MVEEDVVEAEVVIEVIVEVIVAIRKVSSNQSVTTAEKRVTSQMTVSCEQGGSDSLFLKQCDSVS